MSDGSGPASAIQQSSERCARHEHGSYYTPSSIAEAISGRALRLVGQGAEKGLTILDPFCGQGVFLESTARKAVESGGISSLRLIGVDADLVALSRSEELLGALSCELRGNLDVQYDLVAGDSFGLGNAFWDSPDEKWNFEPVEWGEVFYGKEGCGELDIVISNPPYMSFYGRHSRGLGPGMRKKIEQIFGVSEASVNTYVLAVRLALKLVKDGGVLSLLIPSAFIRNRRFTRNRRLLAAECSRVEFDVLGQVFPGISMECGVLYASRAQKRVDCTIHLANLKDGGEKSELPKDVFIQGCGERIARLPQGVFSKIWEGAVSVDEIATVRDGINPGPVSSRKKLVLDRSGPGLKPLLRGSDISPYSIKTPGRWIRYDPSVITEEERRGGASLRRPEVFRPPKIVTRQTASRIIGALDEKGYYCLNSVHSTRLRRRDASREKLAFLLGLFNSSLINCLYRIRYGETVKNFPQVHVYAIRELPVRGHSSAGVWDQEIAARIGKLALAVGTGTVDDALIEEIDQLTCDLYGISDQELKILTELAGME